MHCRQILYQLNYKGSKLIVLQFKNIMQLSSKGDELIQGIAKQGILCGLGSGSKTCVCVCGGENYGEGVHGKAPPRDGESLER